MEKEEEEESNQNLKSIAIRARCWKFVSEFIELINFLVVRTEIVWFKQFNYFDFSTLIGWTCTAKLLPNDGKLGKSKNPYLNTMFCWTIHLFVVFVFLLHHVSFH